MTWAPAFFVQCLSKSLAWSAARVCWLLLAGQGRWSFLFLVDVFVRFFSSFFFFFCSFVVVFVVFGSSCFFLSPFFLFVFSFFSLSFPLFSFFFLCSVSCFLFCVARPVAGPPASIWPGWG